MQITVALTPRLLREPASHAIGVVDVLRATTSLVAMFDGGLIRAIIADTLRDARALSLRNFSLLCGEAKALPLAGFDHGNSPVEFAEAALRGKSAVLWTTNGTRAIAAAQVAPVVVAAALRNRRAASRRLLEEATKRHTGVALVCAGLDRGATFSLEDTVTAGAMVEAMREADPSLELADSAWAALHLWRFYRGDASRAFRHAAHGRALRSMGFERDLDFSAELDVSEAVPVLYMEDGVKTLRLRPRQRR